MVPKAPPAACASAGTVSVDKGTLWYLTRHMLSEYMAIKRSTPLLLFSFDVCQNLFKLNLMAKALSDLQGSIIKSVFWWGFFQIALVILKSTFFTYNFRNISHSQSRKQANHLQPQQLGSFPLFALNICTIHTDFLKTDTVSWGILLAKSGYEETPEQRSENRTYVVKNITGGNHCKSWY